MSKTKCELRNDDCYDWCNGMDKMLHKESNANVKGLVQVIIFDFINGKISTLGVVYRDGASKNAQKLMLNNCPWCGQEILNRKHFKKKTGV